MTTVDRRRPALIATAISVPIVVVLAFAFTAGRTSTAGPSTAAVTVPAPPKPDTATQAACEKVFEKLPVQLGGLNPRKTETDSAFVAAWGDPPVVLRCGVTKVVPGDASLPHLLDSGTGKRFVIWQPDPQRDLTRYTSVDRSVAIELTVRGDAQPLPLISAAVAAALPAVCTGTDAAGNRSDPALPICK